MSSRSLGVRRGSSFDGSETRASEMRWMPTGRRVGSYMAHETESFRHWYPSWRTWKFRRTLSYWVAMMYLEGSINFIVGAAFAMTKLADGVGYLEQAVVDVPYFIGSIAFTLGSYAGMLEVLNVAKGEEGGGSLTLCWCTVQQWREMRRYLSWEPIIGYACYVLGALAFNLNTVLALSGVESKLLVWGPAALGSLAFLIGGLLESCHNNLHRSIVPRSQAQALSLCNTLGAFFYLMASACGLLQLDAERTEWLVNFPYLLGSIAFMLGGLLALLMWKSENYGLGLISEMNVPRSEEGNEHEVIMSMHSQYGCGRSSVWQMPWLLMYIVNASASVLDISLTFHQAQASDVHQLVESVCGFALSHGILLLGSVIHHIPTTAPHSWLLIYMRLVLFFWTANSIYGVVMDIRHAHSAKAALTEGHPRWPAGVGVMGPVDPR